MSKQLCPFRECVSLPDVIPEPGELWRLSDGHLARVMLAAVTRDRRLSFAFVVTRMLERNVPLQAFAPPAYRCRQDCLW